MLLVMDQPALVVLSRLHVIGDAFRARLFTLRQLIVRTPEFMPLQDQEHAEKKRIAEAWTAHKSDDGQASRLSPAPAA
jgi:hypothetical protein